MIELAAAIGGYLTGAIPFALLIGSWRRRDLRRLGTGNLGASNAYRQVGRGWGAVVLLLDAGKAMGPMCFLYFQLGSHWAAAVWAICAFVGHCWPIYLGFARAGRGVAVLAGMFLAFGFIENTLGYLIGAIAGYGAGLAVRRPGFAIVAQILGAIGFLPVIGAGRADGCRYAYRPAAAVIPALTATVPCLPRWMRTAAGHLAGPGRRYPSRAAPLADP